MNVFNWSNYSHAFCDVQLFIHALGSMVGLLGHRWNYGSDE